MTRPLERDQASYRQGLVLGLTMAEIMLLLVFCLLIAMAALMARKSEQVEAAEALLRERSLQEEALRTVLDRLGGPEALAERLPAAGGGEIGAARIDDSWERLLADAGLVSRLRGTGIDVAGLAEAATGGGAASAGLPESPAAAAAMLATERAARVAAERSAATLRRDLDAAASVLSSREGKPTDLPPIITLREDRGFFFETGRATPSPDFASRIRGETTGRLLQLIEDYDVDVIEVIGHTDERPMGGKPSNLDGSLLAAVNGGSIDALTPGDNAGLGLARAVAVARLLKSDERLAGVEVLPLSGGQLIGPDGRLTAGGGGDDRSRRRIEIRLRRSLAGDPVTP